MKENVTLLSYNHLSSRTNISCVFIIIKPRITIAHEQGKERVVVFLFLVRIKNQRQGDISTK